MAAPEPLVDRRGLVRAAVLQMNSTTDVQANVRTAFGLIDQAAGRGARLLVLPEKFHYLGPAAGALSHRESLQGRLMSDLAATAREHSVYLLAGSIWEDVSGEERAYNTTVLFGPTGERIAVYRKLHMFDVEVGGHVYRESDGCMPGDRVVAVRIERKDPLDPDVEAPADVVLGLSVCYDLRFPELYRALAQMGAHIVTVPAAFTMTTGRDHWEPLLRARAIENQAYVVAANQFGRHDPGVESYGRSMIVDPWGIVVARAGDGTAVALADLDLAYLTRVRTHLPSLEHRAVDAYERRFLEYAADRRVEW